MSISQKLESSSGRQAPYQPLPLSTTKPNPSLSPLNRRPFGAGLTFPDSQSERELPCESSKAMRILFFACAA
ncbi:hypothetical protein U1Q18_020900 [Sarracenia purpurea var. burkii]